MHFAEAGVNVALYYYIILQIGFELIMFCGFLHSTRSSPSHPLASKTVSHYSLLSAPPDLILSDF